jgi:hypothetical protein
MFSYYSQPVTLVVTPGITATGAPPTTVLEVATDPSFSSIVISKVLPGAVNGQATATPDHLAAATTHRSLPECYFLLPTWLPFSDDSPPAGHSDPPNVPPQNAVVSASAFHAPAGSAGGLLMVVTI